MLGAALVPGSAAPISTPSPTSPVKVGADIARYHFDHCLAQLRPTHLCAGRCPTRSFRPRNLKRCSGLVLWVSVRVSPLSDHSRLDGGTESRSGNILRLFSIARCRREEALITSERRVPPSIVPVTDRRVPRCGGAFACR